jgi:adenylate cyclase, class 2
MAIETEKKYRLNGEQRQFVLDALADVQAEYAGEDFEENIIYGGNNLDDKNAVLRIRKTQDKTILTYKQSIQNDFNVKQRTEHETEVSDFEELKNIVDYLGFEPRLVYEKRRKTWHFRSVEIVLDELPFGLFLEIEGSITEIAEAEMFLEIEDFEIEYESYPRLTAKHGVRRGDLIEARFS